MANGKQDSVDCSENSANGGVLQFTLREVRSMSSSPRFWIGLTAVVLILAVSGPFDTDDTMTFPTRLVYWALICVSTFFVGVVVSGAVAETLRPTGLPSLTAYLVGGVVAGLPIAGVVWAVKAIGSGVDSMPLSDFLELVMYTSAISAAIVVIYAVVEGRPPGAKPPAASVASADDHPFFRRLSRPIGRDLIALQAQDHYIEVRTTAGSELILMRLGDAERELADWPGIRVHRSWWVAHSHIARSARDNGRLVLHLTDGTTVPVSRSYHKAVSQILAPGD